MINGRPLCLNNFRLKLLVIDIDLFIQNLAEMYDYSSGKVAWKMGKWSVHQWKCIKCQRKPISSIEKGQKKCTLLEVRFKQKRRVLQVLHFKCPSGRHGLSATPSMDTDSGTNPSWIIQMSCNSELVYTGQYTKFWTICPYCFSSDFATLSYSWLLH